MARPGDIDESLVVRVASLSRGSQRWLKTAIQAIRTSETGRMQVAEEEEEPSFEKPQLLKPKSATLEDVITGKADLREQLEAYPELSSELEGLGDIIDLLREAGERRRGRGEEILRELLEGGESKDSGNDDEPPAGSPER